MSNQKQSGGSSRVHLPPISTDPPQYPAAPKRLVITVHGIRTFGRWQEAFEERIRTEFQDIVEVYHYRYGFFTLLAFLLPPFRWFVTRRFQAELLHHLNSKSWSRIDVVAHSFGTHLVGWGLLRTPPHRRPSIHTVIFAGSVLKVTFPFRELVGSCIARLVNDCGNVLLVNQIFVLFTGMAGRVGFSGMENDAFRNRYFSFGHSGYFRNGGQDVSDFFDRYWLPLLRTTEGIPAHDERAQNRLYDLTALALNNAEPIKLAIYALPLLSALYYVNNLRLIAKTEANVALSRQLSAESALLQNETVDLEPAALLAAESMERFPQVGSDQTLRTATDILAHQIWAMKETDQVRVVTFSKSGQYLATGGTDGTLRILEAAT